MAMLLAQTGRTVLTINDGLGILSGGKGGVRWEESKSPSTIYRYIDPPTYHALDYATHHEAFMALWSNVLVDDIG